jgi:hypothetical protein
MIDSFNISLDDIDRVGEPNPTSMNSMSLMVLPSAPLRESFFKDFIGGSFFM